MPVLLTILGAIPGDADLNGKVEFADFLALSAAFDSRGGVWSQGNFDCDSRVDFEDFLILSANFGKTSVSSNFAAVPEQACSVTLYAGAVLSLFRRRRTKRRAKA